MSEIVNAQEYIEKAIVLGGDWLQTQGWTHNPETGVPLGLDVKGTYGLPMRRSKKTEMVILPASSSDANLTEMFLAAHLADSEDVVGLIIRGLLQIATGALSKPNRRYVAAALNLGFGGENDMLHPMAGSELQRTIAEIVTELGEYPHASTGAIRKPAETTLIKLSCENDACKARKGNRRPTIRVSTAWAMAGWTCFSCHKVLKVWLPESEKESDA